jgi:hypothetical protein
MCFSATASFSAAALLTVAGATSLASNRGKAVRMLALMPLLFAAQQLAEGVVWTTVGDLPGGGLHAKAVYFYLFFALMLWPAWVPAALFRFERDPGRRKILGGLMGLGLAISASGAALLVHWPPHAEIAARSLCYEFGVPTNFWGQVVYLPLYVLPTVVPFMISSLALARPIGGVFLLALITTLVFKQSTVTSVWCFFAALLSVLITVALRREQQVDLAPVLLPA